MLWAHAALTAVTGWVLRVLYAINARLARIEQWITDHDRLKGGDDEHF